MLVTKQKCFAFIYCQLLSNISTDPCCIKTYSKLLISTYIPWVKSFKSFIISMIMEQIYLYKKVTIYYRELNFCQQLSSQVWNSRTLSTMFDKLHILNSFKHQFPCCHHCFINLHNKIASTWFIITFWTFLNEQINVAFS